MQSTRVIIIFGLIGLASCELVANKNLGTLMTKVFNYQGSLPIKDERTGELIKQDSNETEAIEKPLTDQELSEAEAACWKLINGGSAQTFKLQNKVLDDLIEDMNKLDLDPKARESIEKIITRMRKNMSDALEALNRDAPDEYFDALFEASEDIINLSGFLRNPQLDDALFLTLIKAVSRLGRNNAALIQDFTEMCSLAQRSPRPRVSSSNFGL